MRQSLVQSYFFCSHLNYKNFKRFFILLPKLYICVCVLRKCENGKRTTIYQHNELAMNE
jgi:hypothetical protein